MDIWPTIETERKALTEDLAGLSDSQWSAGSWCDNWTVQDVVAHMTATAKITPPAFFVKLAGSGFSLTRLQAKDIATEKGDSPADTLARFQAILASRKRPPGPSETMLGEVIVHSQDIRGALGIQHEYPAEALIQVADFFQGSNLIIGTKRRIEGLSLRATDVTCHTAPGQRCPGRCWRSSWP